ncbi:hypothetical protein Ddc_17632 [Ditylenchus destructor]|nr:hypothetical protein Ddc_17632 [Ditylenchus destructor]
MSSLPNEILSVLANFLPNDDITDLMLLSRNFNNLVTPRLKEIDQDMTTMEQHIESFMPADAIHLCDHHRQPGHDIHETDDNEWIPQLNLKQFEPIGSVAKKRAKEVFENEKNSVTKILEHEEKDPQFAFDMLKRLKKGMSLERFGDISFLRILAALVSVPKFRQEYNISFIWAKHFLMYLIVCLSLSESFVDVHRMWFFYNKQR